MSANITLQADGRRVYFVGNTYSVKDALRNAGAHWDAARKAWWTGKKAEAEAILKSLQPTSPSSDGVDLDAKVIKGRATYQGKDYYLLARGISQNTGKPYVKLCFRDGSKVFWASNPADVMVQSEYREPMSINKLRAFAEQAKSDEYRSDNYRIDKNGVHYVKVQGSRGSYWKEADDRDRFDEFDN